LVAREGLKIPWTEMSVSVRVRPGALLMVMKLTR